MSGVISNSELSSDDDTQPGQVFTVWTVAPGRTRCHSSWQSLSISLTEVTCHWPHRCSPLTWWPPSLRFETLQHSDSVKAVVLKPLITNIYLSSSSSSSENCFYLALSFIFHNKSEQFHWQDDRGQNSREFTWSTIRVVCPENIKWWLNSGNARPRECFDHSTRLWELKTRKYFWSIKQNCRKCFVFLDPFQSHFFLERWSPRPEQTEVICSPTREHLLGSY